MGIDVWPPQGSTTAAPVMAFTSSQIVPIGPTDAAGAPVAALAAGGHQVAVPTMFLRSFSGAMVSLSGTYTGLLVVFEGATYDNPAVWRPWPTWHMQHGVWMTSDNVTNNSAVAYWMPSNGATSVRMRVATIASGSAAGGGLGMHAPASIGTGPTGKLDWSGMVVEQVPGNNVSTMMGMLTTASTVFPARGTTFSTSYPVPAGKRLRIHSYAGGFLAGAGGGRCRVDLRSNMAGATVIGSDLLATWSFGPSAGGTGVDERWSGLASALTEPIDIYNNGGGASVGISAMGSAGTTGKLSLTLFGYLVG